MRSGKGDNFNRFSFLFLWSYLHLDHYRDEVPPKTFINKPSNNKVNNCIKNKIINYTNQLWDK